MKLHELEKQATPGPLKAVIHLGRAQVIQGGDGGCMAEFEHVCDFDKSAADALLLAHCRNNFPRALEALHQCVTDTDTFIAACESHEAALSRINTITRGALAALAELETVKT